MKFTFGKYEGVEVSHADTNYLLWVLTKPKIINKHPQLRVEVRRILIKRLMDELPSDQKKKDFRVKSAHDFAYSTDGLV